MSQSPFPAEPMSTGKILDRTFKTYFRRFGAFAVFAFLIQGLFSLVVFILQQVYLTDSLPDLAEMFANMSQQLAQTGSLDALLPQLEEVQARAAENSWVGILTFAANFFFAPIVVGGFAAVASGYFLGEERTPREWLTYTLSKYKALFTTYVCSFLTIVGVIILLSIFSVIVFILFGLLAARIPIVGVLLIIAAVAAIVILSLYIGAAYLMIFPIAVCEDLSGFAPLARALRLGFKKLWKTIGVLTVTGLLVGVAEGLVTGVAAGAITGTSPASLVASGVLNLAVGLFTGPIVPIAMVLLYFSIRIETEGYLAPAPAEYQASRQQWPAQQAPYIETEIPPYPQQDSVPADPAADIGTEAAEPDDPDNKDGGPQGPEPL